MNPEVIVWTKSDCRQCAAVKRRLDAAHVPYTEKDLTAPESAKDLEHFKGLGYSSAPITEYGGIAFPGFMPSEVDRVITAYRVAVGTEAATVENRSQA
jgi:glutaredoxin-like protein NrdH